MKKKLLLLLLVYSSLLLAQEPLSKKQKVDKQLVTVDTSQITSGILYDRVNKWAGLEKFSQDEEPKVSNFDHFKQAWLDIQTASYIFKGLPLEELKKDLEYEKLNNKNEHKVVHIGLINMSLHTLNYHFDNPKSEENGLKIVNEKFMVIKGRKPFVKHDILVISPLKDGVEGSRINFDFDEKFWMEGNGKKIVKLSLEFENQSNIIIDKGEVVNSSVSIVFKESGNKNLKFKVTYEDITEQITYGQLYVKVPDLAKAMDYLIDNKIYDAPQTLAFRGYSFDPDEVTKIRGRLEYRIFYDKVNNNKVLNKPIIIIDGFDPEDKRKIQDSDPHPGISDADHTSMQEFMTYLDGNTPIPFLDELRKLGYDVVIINHPSYTRPGPYGSIVVDGGADYIERNGLAHVGLYQELNSLLARNGSNEQLVIVAPSMGGLISRYALAYMEKNGIPHNTRLWISVDSPHLGANIPLGAQALLDEAYEEGIDAAGDFVEKQLRSKAAQQQLIEQYRTISDNTPNPAYLNARVVEQGYTFNQGSPYFQQFYKNLFSNGLPGSKGYPQNTRRIALVNGSLTGIKDYITHLPSDTNPKFANDSEMTLNIKGFQKLCTPFCYDIHIASLESYNMPRYGGRSKIARFKKLFDDDSMYVTNNNSRGNMDNVPGGWYPTQKEIADSTLEKPPVGTSTGLRIALSYVFSKIFGFFVFIGTDHWSLRDLNYNSSFISTFSALGHTMPDQSWHQALNTNLVCGNKTPFDSYFGQAKNTQHTTFSKEGFEWVKKELGTDKEDINPQEPYFPVSASALIGSSYICRGNTLTYTFAPCSTPTPVKKWSYSGYLTKVSHTGNSITLSAPSDSRIQGWVEAEFFNGVKMRKNIWIGKPITPRSISGPTSVSEEGLVKYRGSYLSGATGYQWRLPYPSRSDKYALRWQITNGANTPYITALAGSNSGLVQFMGSNKCGSGGAAILSVTVGTGGGFAGDMKVNAPIQEGVATIYPNPVDKELNINFNMEELSQNSIISLYDINGKVIYEKKGMVAYRTIDTSNFSEGLYFLVITNGVKQIRNKIIVQH